MSAPSDRLDPVRRLRILAAAHPGCAYVERVLEAPFESVWAVAGDLASGVPQFESTVSRVGIRPGEGGRLLVTTHAPIGPPRTFEAILEPGWCWMQSGLLLVGMAATPVGPTATRFAHLEGVRTGLGRLVRPPLRRKIRGELARIEALARADARSRL